MKYFGGCDVGSTYTKTVILDENGAIVAANTIKSKINSKRTPICPLTLALEVKERVAGADCCIG